MKTLLSPQIVFAVTALLNLIHGCMLIFGTESMYRDMAPGMSEEAITMSATELQVAAAFNFFLAIVLFSCRNPKFPDVKNVLVGTGLGFFCIAILVFKHMSSYLDYPGLQPPFFMVIVMIIIGIWPIFAGLKGEKYQLN